MPIKIDNLCFSYNSEMIIDDLNLKVNDNEILAIVGNTGSGKSTLVQLIAGLLKADKGKIIVDNDDITAKKFNKKILRKKSKIYLTSFLKCNFLSRAWKKIYFSV